MNANQDKTLKQDVADAEALLQNEVPTDAQRFLRWGLLILLIGFGGFVFWATTAPLDAGVPAPATAIVQGERKIIAHPKGGTVKAIHVQEAQYVTKGQPLLELDDTQLRSEYINTLQEYAAQLAQLARLEAEKNGAKEIHFPDSLLDLPPESNAQTQMQLQQQLFAARARALENALNILEQQAQANEANAKAKAQQLALLNRQLESVRQLVNEGYAPRNRLLELEQQAGVLHNEIEQAKRAAADARLKIRQQRHDFNKEVETQLTETRKRVDMLQAKLVALKQELEHMVIRSPVNGYVNNLKVHTIGGVIKPAETIMEIVPDNERIIFLAQVSPQYIDRIQTGQPADIQLGAFLGKPQVIIAGKVIAISPDLIQPQDGRTPPYFETKIIVTEEGKAQLKAIGAQLQPGIPATILIKTGERTLLDYLMRPLFGRLHTALKEE